MRHYSTIYGSAVTAMALLGVVGQVGVGYLYDYYGSYRVALLWIIGGLMMSMLLYLLMGRCPDLEKPEIVR